MAELEASVREAVLALEGTVIEDFQLPLPGDLKDLAKAAALARLSGSTVDGRRASCVGLVGRGRVAGVHGARLNAKKPPRSTRRRNRGAGRLGPTSGGGDAG